MRAAWHTIIHDGGSHGACAGKRLIPMIEVAVMWIAWNIEDPWWRCSHVTGVKVAQQVDIHEGGSHEAGTGSVMCFSLGILSCWAALLVQDPFSVGSGVSHSLKAIVDAAKRKRSNFYFWMKEKIEGGGGASSEGFVLYYISDITRTP
jgi:hypothetical protein